MGLDDKGRVKKNATQKNGVLYFAVAIILIGFSS